MANGDVCSARAVREVNAEMPRIIKEVVGNIGGVCIFYWSWFDTWIDWLAGDGERME